MGGWLCDFLTRRGWTPIGGRKLLVSCGLFGVSLCTMGTVYAKENTTALVFVSASLFLIYIVSSASWATVPIAAPSQYTASLGSIQNFGGYLGAALAPTVTGLIRQYTGHFLSGPDAKRRRDLIFSGRVSGAGAGTDSLRLVVRKAPAELNVNQSGVPDRHFLHAVPVIPLVADLRDTGRTWHRYLRRARGRAQ